ncbi:MAG: DedA family protein [Fimbriimonadia bacterium]
MHPIRRLYDWTIRWARTRHAPYALFAVAFAESSVFPVPPDALLIPMVLSRPKAWIRIAAICTIGSVCGAVLGYCIGWAFYESVGRQIVDAYNLHEPMKAIGDSYSRNAFPTVLTAAFTPIPYKVITIGAGLYNVSLPTVIVASLLGRAGRFFLVAGLLRIFGERIGTFVEKYFDALALAFAALLIGGFLAIKYLF